MSVQATPAPLSGTFQKYRTRGAYHWDALDRHPRRHDRFTATRYRAVLDAAGRRPHEQMRGLSPAGCHCMLRVVPAEKPA